jgi:hypothetical protein
LLRRHAVSMNAVRPSEHLRLDPVHAPDLLEDKHG